MFACLKFHNRHVDQLNRIEIQDSNPCIQEMNLINHSPPKKKISGERKYFEQIVVGKLDLCMQKYEARPLPYGLYKNQHRMEQGLRST